MNAQSGVSSLKSLGHGAPGLRLSLPTGWAYTPEQGPDFTVDYFTSQAEDCTIGICVGLHPSLRARSETQAVVGRSESHALGRTIHWSDMMLMGTAGELFFSEAINEHALAGETQASDPVVRDSNLHLMIFAVSAERADSCKQALRTLDMQL